MANLSKIIYMSATDFNTMINEGSVVIGGVTYTYDNTIDYRIKADLVKDVQNSSGQSLVTDGVAIVPDSPVKSISKNGTGITPDASGNVDITVPEGFITLTPTPSGVAGIVKIELLNSGFYIIPNVGYSYIRFYFNYADNKYVDVNYTAATDSLYLFVQKTTILATVTHYIHWNLYPSRGWNLNHNIIFEGNIQITNNNIVSSTISQLALDRLGMIDRNGAYGLNLINTSGEDGSNVKEKSIIINKASNTDIVNKTDDYKPLVPSSIDETIVEGLGNNSLTMSEQYQSNARDFINCTLVEEYDGWSDV